jgi:hypothetical protein
MYRNANSFNMTNLINVQANAISLIEGNELKNIKDIFIDTSKIMSATLQPNTHKYEFNPSVINNDNLPGLEGMIDYCKTHFKDINSKSEQPIAIEEHNYYLKKSKNTSKIILVSEGADVVQGIRGKMGPQGIGIKGDQGKQGIIHNIEEYIIHHKTDKSKHNANKNYLFQEEHNTFISCNKNISGFTELNDIVMTISGKTTLDGYPINTYVNLMNMHYL